GCSLAGQRVSERNNLHHHDLPDRSAHHPTLGGVNSTANVEDPQKSSMQQWEQLLNIFCIKL
ncbi:MAG: hypothetical protein PHW09_06870, partial [Desulfovibrio desulfuricans]|nr:hypothetical protein [Desulfovibrio desulfuricans]